MLPRMRQRGPRRGTDNAISEAISGHVITWFVTELIWTTRMTLFLDADAAEIRAGRSSKILDLTSHSWIIF